MQVKEYRFRNLAPELSVKMFEEHWLLYNEYVKHFNNIFKRTANPYDTELQNSANPISGIFRDVEKSKTYLTNAVLLHELFFENIILPENSAPFAIGPEFTSMVQKYYPQIKSNDFWSHVIKPAAKSARCWCIVGWNTLLDKMDVCVLDDHGGSLPVGLYPLLVIDVAEHSYIGQYGADRGTYLEHIYRSINWNVVEYRVSKMYSASELMRTSIPEDAEDYIRNIAKESNKETDFGFPDEDSYPEKQPKSTTGLDTRNELAIQPNPRGVSSSVQQSLDIVTRADIEESYNRIIHLSKVTFADVDDMFDKEVKNRGSQFREQLWARLQRDKDND